MRAAFPGLNCCKDSRSNPGAPTLYFIFDVLWTDGADTTGKTLMERRAVLETTVKPATGTDWELCRGRR
jgi:ATP-dependent DNA ligase